MKQLMIKIMVFVCCMSAGCAAEKDASSTQALSEDLHLHLKRVEAYSLQKSGRKRYTNEFKFWSEYIERQNQKLEDLGNENAISQSKGDGYSDAFYVFEHMLEQLKKVSEGVEGYVAYAACRAGEDTSTIELKDIEMAFFVMHDVKLPFSTHMGIGRSLVYEGPKHPGLSIILHSFAARTINSFSPKKYVLTLPLQSMRDILLKNLPEGCVFVGDNNHEERLKKMQEDELAFVEFDDKMRFQSYPSTKQAQLKKESAELAEKFEELLKKAPPRLEWKPNAAGIKDQVLVMKGEKGNAIAELEKEAPIFTLGKPQQPKHNWFLANRVFSPRNTLPYVLVDIEKLAGMNKSSK